MESHGWKAIALEIAVVRIGQANVCGEVSLAAEVYGQELVMLTSHLFLVAVSLDWP